MTARDTVQVLASTLAQLVADYDDAAETANGAINERDRITQLETDLASQQDMVHLQAKIIADLEARIAVYVTQDAERRALILNLLAQIRVLVPA
jgi:hypothetical protein